MIIVQVCVGSSCYLKGSDEIVSKMQQAIEKHNLEEEVVLVGSFCINQCNRTGVTIQVEDDIYSGITPESFDGFFAEHILKRVQGGG